GPRAKALDLDLRQVSLEQPNGKPGVSDIDLRVLGGASIALVGPTGSGKSALAQMMAAQIRPVRGSVWLNKRPLSKWGDVELGEKVGFVPQSLGRASDRSTVRAVIRKSLVGLRWRAQAGNQRTDWALKKLGLEALALRRLETLSYGERRLVAVASLWAQEPDLAIVDEPTAGLDVQNADRVREALEDLSRRGSALILISHDIAFALKLCDRVLLMNQGRIRSDRSVEALQGRRGHVPSSPADLELLHSL
ncbi:MAG: ABC transporter ATP-binding protein, partial [Candidatus Omnitrophica bacterium]|nr:ABC transporter ATP-binding protein [Candidatus Omnitrophota bacterium]